MVSSKKEIRSDSVMRLQKMKDDHKNEVENLRIFYKDKLSTMEKEISNLRKNESKLKRQNKDLKIK